jgi:hypothetical protein
LKSEVGRELKASELQVKTVVWVTKQGRDAMVTMWVREVGPTFVRLYAGATKTFLLLVRAGPDRDEVEDDDHIPMTLYEYLGDI